MSTAPLRVAIVAGEESGDLLGADLVRGLEAAAGRPVELLGVGGHHLQALGLKTLFDPGEIALVGLTAVLARLPRLLRRISATARAVAANAPDCLITIDSPDFSLRVARKVRAANPGIPIVHYVCPSVWAWRPERAAKMAAYVDHVLCILPFEVAELQRLKGPAATYVGHRLVSDAGLAAATARQLGRPLRRLGDPVTLLLLPGSRRSEVRGLLASFGETVDILRRRGHSPRLLLPTVPHVRALVEEEVSTWSHKPEVISDPVRKYEAFGEADAALAASGTVSLELALARIPTVVSYKADLLVRVFFYPLVTIWSASLPNLIADSPVLPEFYDNFVRPGMLARHLEQLFVESPLRTAQIEGFERIARRMATDRPAGALGAEAVLTAIERRKSERRP